MNLLRRMFSLLVFSVLFMLASSAMASDLACEVLDYVNAERQEAGLQPLAMDEGLAVISETRAREAGVYFAHQRPDGRCAQSVMEDVPYSWFGENLAVSTDAEAAEIVQAWMASPAHRANILNRHYTKMGIACTKGLDGYYYWAQLLTCD
ncbi:Cysteine-rich secretory protein family protein [Selenomonas ruminantium]|uniref:Cysteine-rich secretory protein family protein n=1 Tax=Selenomonas ruminantium TaxID=971 RepID=A0A1M6SF31_SELRU|nr:CAP domain-containing protein [Selenomonas ruminantium]SHK43259.1 Cysteine-rich secretory protein family protein [Selenomonas ruminantium]